LSSTASPGGSILSDLVRKGPEMRKLLIMPILVVALMLGGCGSELMPVAGGLAGGFAVSETLKGIEADLANREQLLLDRYAVAVESGAKQETLDKLEDKVANTQLTRKGVEAGKKLLGVDWNNPREAGESILKLGVLAYAVLTKRKLIRTQGGVSKFMANTDKTTANDLYDTIST